MSFENKLSSYFKEKRGRAKLENRKRYILVLQKKSKISGSEFWGIWDDYAECFIRENLTKSAAKNLYNYQNLKEAKLIVNLTTGQKYIKK